MLIFPISELPKIVNLWDYRSGVCDSCSTGKQNPASNIINNLHSNIQKSECKLVTDTKYITYDPQDGEIFDFVIVGVGAAGLVLTNRLSKNLITK